MTPIRYNYSYDLDEETKSLLQKQASSNNRLPLCSLKISATLTFFPCSQTLSV